jgi:hypothetical protein
MNKNNIECSVCTITMRYGWLEWAAKMLASQTFKNFQWIVIDRLYKERKNKLYNLCKKLNINLIHLPEPSIYYATEQNMYTNSNESIFYSSGKYFIGLEDWHVIPDNYIEKHIFWLQKDMACSTRWIHTNLMEELNYQSFSEKAKNEKYFTNEKNFSHKCLNATPEIREKTIQHSIKDANSDHRFLSLKKKNKYFNEKTPAQSIPDWWWPSSSSAPMKYILKCGGYDERFNLGTGGGDCDLAHRMHNVGLQFVYDPTIVSYHINHDPINNIKYKKINDDICEFHDRTPFIKNEYYPNGNPALSENENFYAIQENDITYLKCKTCNALLIADTQKLIKQNKSLIKIGEKNIMSQIFFNIKLDKGRKNGN